MVGSLFLSSYKSSLSSEGGLGQHHACVKSAELSIVTFCHCLMNKSGLFSQNLHAPHFSFVPNVVQNTVQPFRGNESGHLLLCDWGSSELVYSLLEASRYFIAK